MDRGQLAFSGRVGDRQLLELRRTATALGVALLALSTLDIVVTNIGIETFGGVELNPILAPLIGTPWAVVLKIGIPAVVVVLATRVATWRAVGYLRILVSLYLVVTIFGLGQVAVLSF